MERIGYCMYCRQSQMLDVREFMTQDELNQDVTEVCNCEGAKIAREKVKKKDEAVKNIEILFEDLPDIANILTGVVIPIVEGKVSKVVIDTGKKVKAQVTRVSKDNIKVERSETSKTVMEN